MSGSVLDQIGVLIENQNKINEMLSRLVTLLNERIERVVDRVERLEWEKKGRKDEG